MRRRIVITVPGIRTNGEWRDRLELLLTTADSSLEVRHFHFGYFSAPPLAIPWLRRIVARRFVRDLTALALENPHVSLSLVAHSFGTYIVATALRHSSLGTCDVSWVIFAGSVLKSNYDWQPARTRHKNFRLVNECGTKDFILVLNQLFNLFLGMAGHLGFYGIEGPELRNNYYRVGHSGYFLRDGKADDIFMRERWVPLLSSGTVLPQVDERDTLTVTRGILRTIAQNLEPFKIALISALLILPIYLSLVASANHRREQPALGLIAAAKGVLPVDPGLSAVLTREAWNSQPQSETPIEQQSHDVLRESPVIAAISVDPFQAERVVFSADGRTVFISGDTRDIGQWNTAEGHQLRPVLPSRLLAVSSNRAFFAVGASNYVEVWANSFSQRVGTVIPGNSDLIDRVRVELSSKILAHRRMRSLVHDLLVLLSEPCSSSN
jgi:hypothetical protein